MKGARMAYLLATGLLLMLQPGGPPAAGDSQNLSEATAIDAVSKPASHEPSPYEKQLRATLITGVTAVDTLFAAGLAPPPYSQIFETAEWLEDLTLKHLPAYLVAPENLEPIFPNSADQCHFKFVLPQSKVQFTNYFGVVNARRALGAWYEREDPDSVAIADVNRIEACMLGYPADSTTRLLRRKCDLLRNNWGVLGAPEHLWHANTDVLVSVSSASAGIAGIETPQVVSMPAGVHELVWLAETQRDVVMDIIVPPILIAAGVLSELYFARYGDDILKRLDLGPDDLSDSIIDAARYGQFKDWVRRKAVEWVIKEGPKFGLEKGTQLTLNLINANTSVTTTSAFDFQYLSVYDVFSPTIELLAGSEVVRLEATAFGGTTRRQNEDRLRAGVVAADQCGRDPIVFNDAPEFLRMGETTVTWTAADRGPNPTSDGSVFKRTRAQTVIVEDTMKPLVIAPPSVVLESDDPTVNRADVALGTPLIADLADPEPGFESDAPEIFDADSRTDVTWTVTDASGNSTEVTQWVTVKSKGSNTPPRAMDGDAKARTSEEVDIRLRASDADFIDGMYDPVWFTIVAPPTHGQFVAPLLPFFIDDYRTRPTDEYGPAFAEAVELGQANSWIETNVCAAGQQPVIDFVHKPLFAHVMDDGTRFILDYFFTCNDDNNGKAHQHPRISKWDADDVFLGQLEFASDDDEDLPNNEAFTIEFDVGEDRDFLYYSTYSPSGAAESKISLNQCRVDFENGGNLCFRSFAIVSDSAADPYAIDVDELTTLKFVGDANLLYLVDKSRVYAFKPLDNGDVRFLGLLAPPDSPDGDFLEDDKSLCPGLLNGRSFGYGLETDSVGNVYVVDSCLDRIHKFRASTFDEEGNFIAGDYVGWLGKCTRNLDNSVNACDVSKKRSFGFTCGNATCDNHPDDTTAGGDAGQFDTPLYLAVDPNDILYVADYENFRVQRFGPDGTFSGEARSTGTGINSGDKPSFVLGNMDRPRALSVNSTQFFVVDRETRFMHIFGTLPFWDIGGQEAWVTYVSENGFHGQDDSFSFQVNDGLADSNVATVTVSVKRNFRPPSALDAAWTTSEDETIGLQLAGTDPDGVIGQNEDGLDQLTFTIVSPPAHGTLAAAGPPESGLWRYQPDADYFGGDSFTFRANDGLFDSDPETVELEVRPINDPPELTLDPLPRVGQGFPATFTSTFTDDSTGDFTAVQSWGDGSIEVPGDLVEDPATGEYDFEPGKALRLQAPAEGRAGSTSASHVYATLGAQQMALCVRDDEAQGDCRSAVVDVEHLVALSLDGEVNPPSNAQLAADTAVASTPKRSAGFAIQAVAGEPTVFALQVVNRVPEFGEGLAAQDVDLQATLDGDLSVQLVSTSAGTCVIEGPTSVTCDLGSMDNGQVIDLTVQALGPADIIYDQPTALEVLLETTSPAVAGSIAAILPVDILADATDSDGDGMTDKFEEQYGLDPAVDDSGEDPDGDGLTNLEEYDSRTSPKSADTDRDGLSDFDEGFVYNTDPLNEDTDGDGMPDGWEVEHHLDPLKDDALEDADGDGATNLDEYLWNTDPQDDDDAVHLNIPTLSREGLVILLVALMMLGWVSIRQR